MRKTIHNNFRYFFLLIFSLHLSVMFVNLQKELKAPQTPEAAAIKVRFLPSIQTGRQIVESEDPSDLKRPDKTARWSDKNRAFDRETKARLVKPFQKSSGVSLSALGGDIGKKNPFHKAAGEYASGSGGTVSSTSDHIENIPLGDLTHLNTIEYKFFGYYHRIRQKLEGFWGRSVQEKAEQLASGGRALASEEHFTALRIVMNSSGEIVDVVILGSSGVKELDDAAVESFNEAGPFPNPPKGLVVNGRVTIEWGFVVNS